MSPQARKTKVKINKCGYIKLKSFCTMKETTRKMKRQTIEREMVFANDIDKGFIHKIYKVLIQLNVKKEKTVLKNGQRT